MVVKHTIHALCKLCILQCSLIPHALLWLANISTEQYVLVYKYTYMYTFTYCRQVL